MFVTGFLTIVVAMGIAQNGMQPKNLHQLNAVVEIAVSPDSKNIAFVRVVPRQISEGTGSAYRELYVYNIQSGKVTSLYTGKVSVSGISWIPDTDSICFRASIGKSKGRQVFGMGLTASDPTQLTDIDRSVQSFQFSDRNTIFVTVSEPMDEIQPEIDRKIYDMKIMDQPEQHIQLLRIDRKTGEISQLTNGVTVFDFTVSPDGTKIAAAIAKQNTVDDSYMFKRIYILDAATGEIIEKIENPGKLGKLCWSPDSKKLAFLAASKREDSVVGSLFIFETGKNVQYSEIRNYTHTMPISVADVIWKDNSTVYYTAYDGVNVSVRSQSFPDSKPDLIMEGGQSVFHEIQKVGDMLYFSGNTSAFPSELMSFNLKTKKTERLTNVNPWLNDISLARQEVVEYPARDNTTIQGVLIYPLHYTEGKHYPLIVYIHGGPESCIQNGWLTAYSQWGQFAAARDYFVFYPNYRASSGRGVDFTMEGYGALLEKEYEDVLDGIDYLIAQKNVDKTKVGIGGGSYGGYFAAWSATKHTERFAAAVVFVGVTNQISKRNLTDIPWEDYLVHWGFWSYENFEKVWEASPVKYAHQSQTPTLILHGEDDPRVPVTQGIELYREMKQHGKAPVRMVIYPGEGHGNGKNTNRLDYLMRTLDWFDFFLKESHASGEMPPLYPVYE